MESLLAAESISKKNANSQFALSNTSFQVKSGDRLAIVGETGAGKSTLLKLLSGLLQTDTGVIKYRGEKVLGPDEKLIAGHERIAYLSQHFELPKFISVQDFLERSFLNTPEGGSLIYEGCQITHLLHKDTRELSGGEKQRIALAKILLKAPEILVLDEPFSNLDTNHKKIIKTVLRNMYEDLGLTIILVAHVPMDILSWATEIMVLKDGEVIQRGSPKQVYEGPTNEYVAGLFGSYSLVNPTNWNINKEKRTLIDEKVLLRPHCFTINSIGSGRYGNVTNIDYQGSYAEITMDCDGEEVRIHSLNHDINKGDEVKVSIKLKGIK